MLDSVYTYPDIFESATFSFRIQQFPLCESLCHSLWVRNIPGGGNAMNSNIWNEPYFSKLQSDVQFFVLLFYRSWPSNVHILQACFKLMTVARAHGIQSFLAAENLQGIYPYVSHNLCSASHITRLLTLKMLNCFNHPNKGVSDDKVNTDLTVLHNALC